MKRRGRKKQKARRTQNEGVLKKRLERLHKRLSRLGKKFEDLEAKR